MVERCGGQVRTHFGGVYGLDFTAILMMAAAMGAPGALLSEILPAIEPVVVAAYREGTGNDD
ncbi:MAG: hypothetical protein MIN69_05775 [Methylorubrum extorquens]|uniref:DUF7697 family protein n=1 Tax=Methylorubrum extorquens TaxID=408 RepID=UPI002FEE13AB